MCVDNSHFTTKEESVLEHTLYTFSVCKISVKQFSVINSSLKTEEKKATVILHLAYITFFNHPFARSIFVNVQRKQYSIQFKSDRQY